MRRGSSQPLVARTQPAAPLERLPAPAQEISSAHYARCGWHFSAGWWRGLSGVELVTSHADQGLRAAIATVFAAPLGSAAERTS